MVTAFVLNCVLLVAAQNQMEQHNPFGFIPPIRDDMCIGRMDGIVFPDPNNCDAYVRCNGSAVIRLRCQPGTLFDLRLYYCVPSNTINCGSRRKPISIVPNSPNAPTSEQHHSVSPISVIYLERKLMLILCNKGLS